jgi:hypothetical protein
MTKQLQRQTEKPTANTGLPAVLLRGGKSGGSVLPQKHLPTVLLRGVVNQTLVLRINICGENRHYAKPPTITPHPKYPTKKRPTNHGRAFFFFSLIRSFGKTN